MSLPFIKSDCVVLSGRLAELRRRLDRLPGGTRPADLTRAIDETAEEVKKLASEAKQPARVGLIGPFNAGKTRLLEALLGCAGRLNVIDKPATGNIVEFVLEAKDVPETRVEGWKVRFMSEAKDAGHILRRLLDHARQLQNQEPSAAGELNTLLSDAESGDDQRPRWTQAQAWARAAHAKASANQFKAVAFEVYRLAYTVGQAPDWLGREVGVTEPMAVALMSLDHDPREVYSTDLERWRSPVPAFPAAGSGARVSPQELRALFPIVRKITATVALPPRIAEPLGGASLDMRLVDCPGAGADGTNFRDTVLCSQELRDVDAVLALLNAKNPGESRGSVDDLLRIWGPAARDRLLAVASRFDELPHDKNVSAGRRDAFADDDGPLTSSQLLATLPTLDTIYKAALQTVMDQDADRVCFVSAMGFLSERLQAEGRGLRGSAEAFYQRELGFPPAANQEHQPWVREMGGWYPVAERLLASPDKPSRALGGLLRDFSTDGGFGRLYRVLGDHLASHAQSNKLERLLLVHGKLGPRVQSLELAVGMAEAEAAAAAGAAGAAEDATPANFSAEKTLRDLEAAYRALVVHAKSRAREFTLVEPDPQKLLATREILPLLRRGLAADLMRWKQWQLLLSRVGRTERGLVALVDPSSPELARREFERQEEAETPVKSDDFLAPFLESMSKIRNELRRRSRLAWSHHVAAMKQDLEARLGGPAAVPRLREGLPAAGLDVSLLDGVVLDGDVTWLDGVLPEKPAAGGGHPDAETFPLQHDGKPLYYAWHKPLYQRYPGRFESRHRHMMYVVRLRHVLVEAALRRLDSLALEVEQAMRSAIVSGLTARAEDLRRRVASLPPEDAVPSDYAN